MNATATSMLHESPPSARELLLRGYENPVGYACPVCSQLFLLTHEDHRDDKRKKEVAERARLHCHRFCACGNPIERPYWLRCNACAEKAVGEKEAARFAKAQKVSIEDYPDQHIFWDGRGPEDGYFESIDELLDYCDENDQEPPHYVWACRPTDFSLDAEEIIDYAIEHQQHPENTGERIPKEARKNLQAYLNVWCEELKIRSWHVDYRRVVLLSPDHEEAS